MTKKQLIKFYTEELAPSFNSMGYNPLEHLCPSYRSLQCMREAWDLWHENPIEGVDFTKTKDREAVAWWVWCGFGPDGDVRSMKERGRKDSTTTK